MKYIIKIAFTTISGIEGTRLVVINAASRQDAVRVASGVAVVLERGPGRAVVAVAENQAEDDDSITLEEAIIWAIRSRSKRPSSGP